MIKRCYSCVETRKLSAQIPLSEQTPADGFSLPRPSLLQGKEAEAGMSGCRGSTLRPPCFWVCDHLWSSGSLSWKQKATELSWCSRTHNFVFKRTEELFENENENDNLSTIERSGNVKTGKAEPFLWDGLDLNCAFVTLIPVFYGRAVNLKSFLICKSVYVVVRVRGVEGVTILVLRFCKK